MSLSSEQESFDELTKGMREKEQYLKRALDMLGEQYNGVVILVHCYDPVCQTSVNRSVTQGDPLAARQLAVKFLHELEWQDQLRFQKMFNRLSGPDENNHQGQS